MSEDGKRSPGQWMAGPTAKERSAAERSVNALLNSLAPEKTMKRAEPLPVRVEQHRTPSGCVLQAPAAALSVSWFASSSDDSGLGELQVVVWRGVVSRRGSPQKPDAAAVVREVVLRPMERSLDDCVWRADDGSTYDTDRLVARCLALLEEQIDSA